MSQKPRWSLSSRSTKRSAVRRRRLFFEPLEARRVLAIDAALIGDIAAGADSGPSGFMQYGSNVYFSADDGAAGMEVWRTNGTTASLFADLHPSGSSNPRLFTVASSKLFFAASTPTTGIELWVTDGVAAPQVFNVRAGNTSSSPANLTSFGGELYFAADGGGGRGVWHTNGIAAPVLVPGTTGFEPSELLVSGGKLYFAATPLATPTVSRIYTWDGTTLQVLNISGGTGSYGPVFLTDFGGTVYFSGFRGTPATGQELFKVTGPTSVDIVMDIRSGPPDSSPSKFTVAGSNLFFKAHNGTATNLWRTFSGGTQKVTDPIGVTVPASSTFASIGSTLYFVGTSASGTGIFTSDGTTITSLPQTLGMNPDQLTNVGGTLYFVGTKAATGRELYYLNGSTPTVVRDIQPGSGPSLPDGLTAVGNSLYFSADDGLTGIEPWIAQDFPSPQTISQDADGNLVVRDNAGGNDDWTISSDGSGGWTITGVGANFSIVGTVPAGITASGNTIQVPASAAASFNKFIFNTLAGNDQLTVALAAGDAIPTAGIEYHGGDPASGPSDKLAITGGNQGTVTYNYANAHDGSVVMSNYGAVSYTGLEPITNSGAASDVIFNLPAGPSTGTLGDDGTSGNGLSRLSSSPATFEQTDFSNPTGSLTINRGSASDILAVNALSDFTSSLTLGSVANPFSTISFAGEMTLAPGKSLAAAAGAINSAAAAAVAVSGGASISLHMDAAAIDAASTFNAGTGTGSLSPLTVGQDVDLGGTDSIGVLGLTEVEFDRFSAGTIQIGDANTGSVNVVANIDGFSATNVILTGSSFTNTATGILQTNSSFAINALSTNEGTILVNGGSFATSGPMTNSGNVTISLGSTLTTNGAYTQTAGATTVIGALTTAGSSATIEGGILRGTGSVPQPVIVNAPSMLSPGLSPGIFSTGNLLQAGVLAIEIAGNGGAGNANGFDQVLVTGSVTIDALTATLSLNTSGLIAAELNAGDQFVIINNDLADAVTGTFGGLPEGATVLANAGGSGLALVISYLGGSGNDVVLIAQETASLQATLVGSVLTITDISAAGKNNSLAASIVGTSLVFTDATQSFLAAPPGGSLSNGDRTLTIPQALVTSVVVNLAGGMDALNVDLAGTTSPALAVNAVFGGQFSFGNRPNLTYSNAEAISTSNGRYQLTLDMQPALGGGNGAADTITANVNGPNLELRVSGQNEGNPVYSGQQSTIDGLRILGSTDSDMFVLLEAPSGLPSLGLASVGAIGGHTSPTFTDYTGYDQVGSTPVDINFQGGGGGGTDSLTLNLTAVHGVVTTPDSVDLAFSGNIGIGIGPLAFGTRQLGLSYGGLEGPVTVNLAIGSGLTYDASEFTGKSILLTDDAIASNGVSQIQFASAASVAFGGAASALVRSGPGADSLDLMALDSATTLSQIFLDGDNLAGIDTAADTLRVHSSPAGVTTYLFGGQGNDMFRLHNSASTVDAIAGSVVVSPQSPPAPLAADETAGSDTLIVIDSGDGTGDTAAITHSTIEGLTSYSGAPDLSYAGIETLDVTGTGGGDTLTTNLGGTVGTPTEFGGLVSVNIRGNGGDDTFFLHVADRSADATLDIVNLFGDLGSDTFGSATDKLQPVLRTGQTQIALHGGSAAASPGPGIPYNPFAELGDKLFLDLTSTWSGTAVTPIVIVDTNGGNADSVNTQSFRFTGIEDLDLYDGGALTSAAIGDFFARGTEQGDLIQFTALSAGSDPTFRLRVSNTYYPSSTGSYGPYFTLTTTAHPASKMYVYGRGGIDSISMGSTRLNAAFFGEAGDDVLTGGYGDDLIVGGSGNDRLSGSTVGGNDEIWGDDYNPAVDNPAFASQAPLGGNDQINTYGGNDAVYGQGGSDGIYTGAGDDYISGGDGVDQVNGQAGSDRIYGGAGNDVLAGGDGSDVIAGGAGDDTLLGDGGNNILIGGTGKDTANGGNGRDVLVGNDSNGPGGGSSLFRGDVADAALLALLSLWASSPTMGSLGGFGSGADDGSVDTLWGGTEADAFFTTGGDQAADRNAPGYGPDLN